MLSNQPKPSKESLNKLKIVDGKPVITFFTIFTASIIPLKSGLNKLYKASGILTTPVATSLIAKATFTKTSLKPPVRSEIEL
ncbi:hypothetical protein JCM19376_14470 [Fusibacter bizertensis]